MKKNKFLIERDFIENLVTMLVVMVIVFLVNQYIVMPTRVVGTSMYPTLHDGDFLLVNRLSYTLKGPERFDIIVFEEATDDVTELLIKRVIALPGESVFVTKDGKIYVDGELLKEYYWHEPNFNGKDLKEPIILGADEYFVLGDNRIVSLDSRCDEVGAIHKSQIKGKAVFRVLPFIGFGSLGAQ